MIEAVLALDLGASSGRAIIGGLNTDEHGKKTLTMEEIHRFSNDPVRVGTHMHWDILRLLHEVKRSIWKANQLGYQLNGIGIDSWAVDFGLLDKNGNLLGNPHHYRDTHTNGVMEQVCEELGKERIFASTGLQFLPFNTIYQLTALERAGSVALSEAHALLMIPDLLRYFLTGESHSEYTNATTTQLFNAMSKEWDRELLNQLQLPERIFQQPLKPGTIAGKLTPEVCEELLVPSAPVIAVGEHDTASAVAAVPATESTFAYLICGTWSLLGTELKEANLSLQALELNFTNEGGVEDTFRFLKNIMGLWIVQECKRAWDKEGNDLTYAQLVEAAMQQKPFQAFIDPDDASFLNPPRMPEAVRAYCERTNQTAPTSEGAVIRCVLESLALRYRAVLEGMEQVTGQRYAGIHMVGGGIHNELLCQMTANAIGLPVWAGPAEASAIGNIAVQYMALGKVANLKEARSIIAASFPVQVYEPENGTEWEAAYEQFGQVTNK